MPTDHLARHCPRPRCRRGLACRKARGAECAGSWPMLNDMYVRLLALMIRSGVAPPPLKRGRGGLTGKGQGGVRG